jgi:branched-chain amino acid transport system substrate-binding protein
MALTGGSAGAGRQYMLALEIWRDEVNGKGGLLGRPVELDYYDDQSNPANVPAIYTKLINIDKIDLLIGPYATNMVAPSLPVIMQSGKVTMGLSANAANSEFHYPKYFSMTANEPDPKEAYSRALFDLAKTLDPAPRTVAIVGVDAEFGRNATDGARDVIKRLGFTTVYDKSYPPTTTDFAPVLRAVQATHPDIVYVAAYPPDSVGIIHAANEIDLDTKLFGGVFVGLGITANLMQLGPSINGIVTFGTFLPKPGFAGPGAEAFIERYEAQAPSQGVDPLGYTFPPFGYSAGQVMAQAVTGAGTLDPDKLGAYMRGHVFHTVLGDISFGTDGEWTKTGTFFGQFQHVAGNGIDQFKGAPHLTVVAPADRKTGELIYPYAKARQ